YFSLSSLRSRSTVLSLNFGSGWTRKTRDLGGLSTGMTSQYFLTLVSPTKSCDRPSKAGSYASDVGGISGSWTSRSFGSKARRSPSAPELGGVWSAARASAWEASEPTVGGVDS